MQDKIKLSIIAPCFNEEGNIDCFIETVSKIVAPLGSYEILLVDDGSSDDTLSKIRDAAAVDSHVRYLSLSRNWGHQNALWAGLTYASGQCVVSLDCDLQQPPEMIPTMLQYHDEKGYDVVYTLRQDSSNTGFFKKITSHGFYWLNGLLSDVKIPAGAADFRLLDRKVVDAMLSLRENSLFIRGLVVWCGFRQIGLPYIVRERHSGTSKYTLRKMLHLAFFGITAFSIKPLRFSIWLGGIVAFLALLYSIYACFAFFVLKTTIPGWTSLAVITAFLDSMILIMLGIIGEYLGRTFVENKQRPNYFIQESNISEKTKK